MDGTLVVYDKEKEDAPFSPEETANGTGTGTEEAEANGTTPETNLKARIQVNKSVHSKNQKVNPVASWKLSHQRINAFAFSHDSRHLAVVSEDGTLRIIDYLKEEYVLKIRTISDQQVSELTWSISGCWTCIIPITAVSSLCAGRLMVNTFSQAVKTT